MAKMRGFANIQNKIASKCYGMKAAGAILAKKTRQASPAAKAANPRLDNVRMPKRGARVSRRGGR
jgi:hypothetical protein